MLLCGPVLGFVAHPSPLPSTAPLQLVTAGADKALKIWDMASLTCVKTIVLGGDVGDMQNSVVWTSTNVIVSLSLSGALNFFRAGEDEPFQVVVGHQVGRRTQGRVAVAVVVVVVVDGGG